MKEMKESVFPLDKYGNIDKDAVKELYMASKHLDWTRFAEEQGYNPHTSRRDMPAATWQAEKRRKIAENETEHLTNLIFERRFRWHNDVIQTLEHYPKANDMVLGLILQKAEQIRKDFDDDKRLGPLNEDYQFAGKTHKRTRWRKDKWSPGDLNAMANAMKAITEAKHKSLMLNNWSIEKAVDDSKSETETNTQTRAIMLQVKGHPDGITAEDWQKMCDEYLDKPLEPTDVGTG